VVASVSDDAPVSRVRPPRRWATGAPAVAATVERTVSKMGVRRTLAALRVINQPSGFDCPGCGWPEPPPGERHRIEFCESGAKAVAEEATVARVDDEFFARYSVADLVSRSDFWLGEAGRLTSPMIKRPGSSHYEPIGWDDAFVEIARQLHLLDTPDEAIFYTSGRTGNEAAFLYQLMVRSYGTNNLPDCSNLCHEPTSFALGRSIGIGKGSVQMHDFALADVILVVGQNPGSNHPRMLTTLEHAKRAGVRIIAINPLPEAGLIRYKNPQTLRGLVGHGTEIADVHLPIRLGGDQALFQLWNRRLLTDSANDRFIDHPFIADHTTGFGALRDHLADLDEARLLAATGLTSTAVDEAFAIVANARRLIICWAMGITQHLGAVDTIDEMTNLALLGGHIGRPGAGLCPIRGHSNVQGDRTMGIFEQPPAAFLDALEAEFAITMPRERGLDTLDAVRALSTGRARVMVGLGGNFVRATPDTDLTEHALAGADLTVQISTKLNRSHLVCGDTAIILPTFGRTDTDNSVRGAQFVTVEDSMGIVHTSKGNLTPPSADLRSETTIICDLALAVLGPDHPVDWRQLRGDNDLVRDHIATVVPGFTDFNQRVRVPGGFVLPHPPRDSRTFPTIDGKARFTVTTVPGTDKGAHQLVLQTLRSHDQYNTTIYGHHDRYRGISGDRHVIMINPDDITRLGHTDGDRVDIVSTLAGPERRARGYRIIAYPTPVGCAAAYYPEANVLLALDHHGPDAQTPAAKAIPIRLERAY
jgi:molybdopterin-dependent oxidoreductase alpha subunit